MLRGFEDKDEVWDPLGFALCSQKNGILMLMKEDRD